MTTGPLAAFDLTGKRAVVTGASGGLGLHFARVLSAAGAEVALAARRAPALQTGVEALRATGAAAESITLDVTDEEQVRAMFAGRAPYDLVINNAGVATPRRLIEADGRDYDQVMAVNLRGAFLVATEAARALRAADRPGAIVNITSVLASRVAGEVGIYAASKAALLQFTRAMALEWARFGIRVNALSPGYVETDINREFFATEAGAAMIRKMPQRRLGQARDLDGALLLLASDAGRFMTGAEIVVDGGHSIAGL